MVTFYSGYTAKLACSEQKIPNRWSVEEGKRASLAMSANSKAFKLQ